MKKESNLPYKLKYSEGKITKAFIESVIESLEHSGDFQITSLGHTKFILFVAGNQPPLEDNMFTDTSYHSIMFDQHKIVLKRLHLNFLECSNGGGYKYLVSRSGDQWYLSDPQRNTLFATIKPNPSFLSKHQAKD
jgi:hypothetical protein